MPKDMALKVTCAHGVKYFGEKFEDIPRDYIEWLYYNANGMAPIVDYAVRSIMESKS